MQQSIIRFVVRAVFVLAILFGFNSLAYAQEVPPPVPVFDIPEQFVMPGTTEGDDTHFTITDSRYLNVTLDSSEQIKLKMDSVPEMVTLAVEQSASSTATSTLITLSGFVPSTTFYKYEDSYHNLDQFVTDANGTYSYTQDLSSSHISFIQPRHSTKFIKDDATGGDCTTIGIWDNATKVCTMNTDLTETIQIDSDGVTLDGNGHTLTGYKTGNGVYLNGRTGVTIKNLSVNNFSSGILLYYSNNNTLTNNTSIYRYGAGVGVNYSNGNTLTNNLISGSKYGITLSYSSGNTLTNNTGSNNGYGISLFIADNNTLVSNTISNINNYSGYGISLSRSNGNTLTSNTVSNTSRGIYLEVSENNFLISNTVSNNRIGMRLDVRSNSNTLKDNTVLNSESGISLGLSNNNTLTGNTASSGYYGIMLEYSNSNILTRNTILNNSVYGIFLYSTPPGNKIFNNNLVNNATQVYNYTETTNGDIFNLASPVGGNYWSNFDTPSEGCNDVNNDSICDSPYVFAGEQDNLPWTKQDGWPATALPTCTVDCYSNIMFLPGIEASRLYRQGELFGEDQLWEPNTDGDVKDLFLDSDGNSIRKDIYLKKSGTSMGVVDEINVLPPPLQKNVYMSFLNDLKKWKETDHLIANYGVAPYDWRLSLEDIVSSGNQNSDGHIYYGGIAGATTTPYIIQELERLASDSKSCKVTIVAHSNGGLVTKALIKKLKDKNNPLYNKIDKIIFVAVPQLGTPMAVGALLNGFDQGLPKDWAPLVLTPQVARAFASTSPMTYNLLPSSKYFDIPNIRPVATFDNSDILAGYRAQYGTSINSSVELKSFATDESRMDANDLYFPSISKDLHYPMVGKPALYTQAETLHNNELDNWAPATSTKLYEIAGWGLDTLATIDYKGEETTRCKISPSFPGGTFSTCFNTVVPSITYDPKEVLDGDGTVVTPSALWTVATTTEKYWVNLGEYNKWWINGNIPRKHADILEVPSVRNLVQNIITKTNSQLGYISTVEPLVSDVTRLRILLHSPLNLSIVDNSGNTTSYVTSAIPGADYRRYGEVQVLTFPKGTPVTLNLDGYASGSFTLDMQEINGFNEIIASSTIAAIPTATSTNATMVFTDGTLESATPLAVDYNGDNSSDFVITPKLGETVLFDLTSPVTTATPSGTLGSNGYYASAVTVNLTADDIAPLSEVSSGVADTKYSLDNGTTWNTYSTTTPLIIATEGTTTLQYYSVDNNGNSENIKNLTLNIDTVAPTIFASDVSAEQLTPSGTSLVVAATAEDNVDANPVLVSSIPLTQTFAPGTTEIALTATDIAGNTSTTTIIVTIFSSPTADPDGDCVVNADDVNPFDANVFANLVIPAEYSFWEKERFTLPFSVAGKGMAKLSLSAYYYKVSENPIRDASGAVVSSTSAEIDGIITISFPQNTKELTNYSLELTTKKGNTKERDSIKKKHDNEGDEDRRHELGKELDFASAPITLSLQNLSCSNTTSQNATVNIYDKQQSAQVQYKYKDIGTLDFIMKSDDVIKIKKGQPLSLTVKVTGAKKSVLSDVSLSGNFATLSVVQEDEHHDDDDRKQKTFTLFYPLSTQTTQENIVVNLTVGGITKSETLSVKFED